MTNQMLTSYIKIKRFSPNDVLLSYQMLYQLVSYVERLEAKFDTTMSELFDRLSVIEDNVAQLEAARELRYVRKLI